jgi:hypothetical protein
MDASGVVHAVSVCPRGASAIGINSAHQLLAIGMERLVALFRLVVLHLSRCWHVSIVT